jgi:hypothetical protein
MKERIRRPPPSRPPTRFTWIAGLLAIAAVTLVALIVTGAEPFAWWRLLVLAVLIANAAFFFKRWMDERSLDPPSGPKH